MLFNTLVFLIFAAVFFAIWPGIKNRLILRSQFIVLASFIFYGWWVWRFLFLIIGSGLIDFLCGLAIEKWRSRKKLFLGISLVGNLGSLAIFKYLDFFIVNLNSAGGLLGAPLNISPTELILPVGISFYTFQSMSYTIDIYRDEMKPTRHLSHFFAYLSMFPQLVAGPIVRAKELIPEIENGSKTTGEDIWVGFRWIVHGYFKKMVIADSFAPAIAKAFDGPNVDSSVFWWLVVIMFAFQIYCDFSGYSDIARGLGRWMGFDFPENFNHPYVAEGFRDFWSRWHISLSTWFRDYVYVPLGGNRQGNFKAHSNMWITMVVSGLWHGAAWTFIVWGALHALYMSIERLTRWPKRLGGIPLVGRYISIVITFVLACVAWVFFRAESFPQAMQVIGQLGNISNPAPNVAIAKIGLFKLILIGLAIGREAFFAVRLNRLSIFEHPKFDAARVVLLAIVIVLTILFRGPGASFVYFQF